MIDAVAFVFLPHITKTFLIPMIQNHRNTHYMAFLKKQSESIDFDFVNALALLCHGPLSKKKAKAKKAGNG